MDQPNVYWTLTRRRLSRSSASTPTCPSGGAVAQDQIDWLVGELQAADPAVPVADRTAPPPAVLCDAHHGGSAAMGQLLDGAFAASGSVADMVLTGHVHDYQRFTRTLDGSADSLRRRRRRAATTISTRWPAMPRRACR